MHYLHEIDHVNAASQLTALFLVLAPKLLWRYSLIFYRLSK